PPRRRSAPRPRSPPARTRGSGLGLPAQARGEVGHGADGAVVPAPFEADRTDGRVAQGDPDAQGQVVASLAPAGAERGHPIAHGDRHADRALDRVNMVETPPEVLTAWKRNLPMPGPSEACASPSRPQPHR